MIYLYYCKTSKRLYLFTHPSEMKRVENAATYWTDIESVTADKERGQVVAHKFGDGIVLELPLGRTTLTCQQPV